MPVWYLLENVQAEPLPKFHHALLVTGRTEMTAFAGKCQQVFVATVFAFHTGKAMTKVAAIPVTVDHLFDIRPPEAVIP